MPKATWNGMTLAESNKGQVVEGNCYSPPQSIKREHLQPSTTHTTCPWKGEAGYYDIGAGGKMNKDAAKHTAGYVAFWKGVQADDR